MGRYDSFKNMEREIVKDVVRDEVMNQAVRGEVSRERFAEDVNIRVRREFEDRAIDSMIRRRR